jgi:hypothetical protein
LAKNRSSTEVNAACASAMDAAANLPSLRSIKTLLASGNQPPTQTQLDLREADPIIRPLSAYSDFIRSHCADSIVSFDTDSPEPTTHQTTDKAS